MSLPEREAQHASQTGHVDSAGASTVHASAVQEHDEGFRDNSHGPLTFRLTPDDPNQTQEGRIAYSWRQREKAPSIELHWLRSRPHDIRQWIKDHSEAGVPNVLAVFPAKE